MPKMSEELVLRITSPTMHERIVEAVGTSGFALLVALAEMQPSDDGWVQVSNSSLYPKLRVKTDQAVAKLRRDCMNAGYLDFKKGKPNEAGLHKVLI